MNNRASDLARFYGALENLEQRLGGKLTISDCSGRMVWPKRGVYFFFEASETRSDTGTGPRVVRVGTHALTAGSGSSLWGRLSQHRGQARSGGGNHRGSIFRLLVGAALKRREGLSEPASWGLKSDAGAVAKQLGIPRVALKEQESELERTVSEYVGAMQILWLPIDDAPGPQSLRGLVERNAIALLSNYQRVPLDPPSPNWLGRNSDRKKVSGSGLWNNRHVDETHDPEFIGTFESLVGRSEGSRSR